MSYLVLPLKGALLRSHALLAELAAIDAEWNPRPWSECSFQRELESPVTVAFGGFVGELLVGYIMAHRVLDEAHIVTFGVRQGWRSRGIGGELITQLLERLKEDLVTSVTLDVRRHNTVAQAVYCRHGFRSVGLRPRFYESDGEDGVTMRRDL